MRKKAVIVHETGSVNRLFIENRGDQPVFVQSGEIVKGGRQDRVLTTSLLLVPNSGKIPIEAFCVEQGRWAKRGNEALSNFAYSLSAIPSRRAKLAMKAPGLLAAPDRTRGYNFAFSGRHLSRGAIRNTRQQEVWKQVAKTQGDLSRNIKARVAATRSPSSLQLTLENKELQKQQAGYLKALDASGQKGDDIIGYAFAINGQLNSADIYPSNGLFRKMWGKNLKASITEALTKRDGKKAKEPLGKSDVRAFLDASAGKPLADKKLPGHVRLKSSKSAKAYFFETQNAKGLWMHRNFLAH